MSIKRILGRFLPIPARSFNIRFHKAMTSIQENKGLIVGVQKQVQENIGLVVDVQKQVQENIGLIIEIQKQIQESIRLVIDVQKQVQESKSLVQVIEKRESEILVELKELRDSIGLTYESSVLHRARELLSPLIPSFIEFMKRPDFEQCFLNLMNGLDDQSRKTIVSIHHRIITIRDTDVPQNLFSQEEQKEIRAQTQALEKAFRLTDNCWCMGEYMLPVNRFYREVFFDKHGTDMVENIEYTSKKCIIDVGAFIGDSLLILSRLTCKQVHCFEAMTENFELLQKTIALNNVENVVPVKKALGAERGKLEFGFLRDGGSSRAVHLVPGDVEKAEMVDVITLDEYVAENNLEVGLIKADIEGSEQEFLKGAKKTICEQLPILIISIYHKPEDFYFIKPMIESWDLGYSFKIHKPINEVILTETILIAEVIS